MQTHFLPFPELPTARLELRALLPTDAPEIFVLRSDPRMLEYLDIVPAKTIEDAEAVMQMIKTENDAGKSIFWCITLKNSPTLIGTICLWNLEPETATAELGYLLHPDFWGQGYMQEALVGVVAFGLEVMDARVIEAYTKSGHLRSARLLERNHFVHKGTQEDGYELYVLAKE